MKEWEEKLIRPVTAATQFPYSVIYSVIKSSDDKAAHNKLKHSVDYYKKNPHKYAEEYLGLELTPWQKLLMRMINESN